MHIAIDPERFEKLPPLRHGSHTANDTDMCVMEAVAWVTHKEWSDHPPCVCPVISAFMRSWNDGLPNDDERTALLKPLIPKLINTRGSAALEQHRATMAADWLVREHTVAWLRLAKLDAAADALATLPEITDFANCPPLMPALKAARESAAAWAAARDAARAAAWDAAWAAAWDAARAAAWDAARAAAWDALASTRLALQKSAAGLVERMCALTESDLKTV
jgi:hypothetical protein